MEEKIFIRTALISVSDKTGLTNFANKLSNLGIKLLSTGGTFRALKEAGLDVTEVSDHTGFPEMMDGRIKTLHPTIHGGILARRDEKSHTDSMDEHGISGIDMVVVNLYPFEETVAAGKDFDTCIENIDIGGPAMIRSAAKNHAFVTVVTDVGDYDAVIADMEENDGATTHALRQKLAARAFARTASYDSAISGWFADQLGETFPNRVSIAGELQEVLRYGENPHQEAAFYRNAEQRPGVAGAKQIQGKALSYNNLNDTDAAFELVAEFDRPAIAIIKHANPCGVAMADTLAEAYDKALRCDPVSAFGGIVAANGEIDAELAEKITKVFTEVVIAPSLDDDAKEVFATKKNLRVLITGAMPDMDQKAMNVKTLSGGFLLQDRDTGRVTSDMLRTVTERQPSQDEMRDLLFAFKVCKHVKSNAIVYARNGATVGIGAGQMSRVDSARIAAQKADDATKAAGLSEPLTKDCVVASDAFFPFADGLLSAVQAGAKAVIQPGGSIRDDEVIEAANDKGIAMVMTGMRHFRH